MYFAVPIRLAGRNSHYYGRVEVYYNDKWRTVCDVAWDYNDATVVCRQLGFYSSGGAYRSAHFGEGKGPIWLRKLYCVGNEPSIFDCAQSRVAKKKCTHSNDASVRCYGTRRKLLMYFTAHTIHLNNCFFK